MQLDIVTPDRRVVVSNATDVIVPGLEGEFDILPNHAPVLSMLGTGVLRFVGSDGPVSLMVSGGFVEVDGDRVVLMCESAALVEEIVAEDERKAFHAVELKLKALGAASPEDLTFQELKAEVDRAAAKLTLVR